MSRTKVLFRCRECGGTAPQWLGRCPGCDAWSTLEEERSGAADAHRSLAAGEAMPMDGVTTGEAALLGTGVSELDRVLAGGLVPGSATVIGGEPGAGKSTLALQAARSVADGGGRVLYASGEESSAQIRARAERLGAVHPRLWVTAEARLPHVLARVDEIRPQLLVVDSVHTLVDPDLGSAPGSVTQVQECAGRLAAESKGRDLAVVLVGHVTKQGTLAGPRALEHLVDTVLSIEGDRHHSLRLIRAAKHRFGPTTELGVLEMTGQGLVSVDDPSELFLADRQPGVAGSVITPTVEGRRPLLVEVQALVVESSLPAPRRSAHGLEAKRLGLLLAVLQQRVGIGVGKADVYALAAGGVRLTEPGVDLAVALAVVSSVSDVPVPADVVACGEIGLAGEVRRVEGIGHRLAEAGRVGFARALVPPGSPAAAGGLAIREVRTVEEAVDALGLAA